MKLKSVTFGKVKQDAEKYKVVIDDKKRIFDIQEYIVIGFNTKYAEHKKLKNIQFIQRICRTIYENLIDDRIKELITNRGPLYMIDKDPYKLKEFDSLIDKHSSYKHKTGFAENSPLPGFLNMSTYYNDEEISECIITHEYGHTIYHSLPPDLHTKWEKVFDLYNVKNDTYEIDAWIFKRNPSECFSEILQIYLNVTHREYATGGIFCENMKEYVPKMYKFMKKIMVQSPQIRNIYKEYNVTIEDTIDTYLDD